MAETREQMAARLETAAAALEHRAQSEAGISRDCPSLRLSYEGIASQTLAQAAAERAGAAALRAQGWLDIGTLTDGVVEPDSAEWWRQVAQGLAAEYHKLKQSWPRCEWRPYPGGPQCEKPAGHGPAHYTISDKPMGASMGKPHSGPHIHHHYKPSVDDPNICGMCGDGPWGIHRFQVTFDNCPICIEAARLRECANAQEHAQIVHAYQQEQAQEWQPIETAPKDGTTVIVALISDGRVQRVSDARFSGVGWYTRNGGVACHWRTHWMPLPAPPEAQP